MAKNPIFFVQTKHVKVYYHFIREKDLQGETEMEAIRTDDQVGRKFINELSTKTLNTSKFEELRRKYGYKESGVEGEC